jgi:hypothetical protein
MMPNANRRRGAYSGWTRRRVAAAQPPESRPRLERSLRRGPLAETAVDGFSLPGSASRDPDEIDKAVVFCLDAGGHVLSSGEVAFTSRAELARRLAEDVRRYAVVEAWQGCVCLVRLGGPAWPYVDDEM